VSRVDGRTVVFTDGREARDVDAVIMCTGYLHHFPFLPVHLRPRCRNSLVVPLWHGVALPDNPGLLFLGMHDLFYSFTMFEVQGCFARDVIL